jgi:hypothetical protein
MGKAIKILVSPFILYFLWSCVRLFRNYRIAKRIGLPVVVVFFDPENLVRILLGHRLRPVVRNIPLVGNYLSRFAYTGWEHEDKARLFVELGDAVVFATPGKVWVQVANAESTMEILNGERQNRFGRPTELLAMLGVFGPSISTVRLCLCKICLSGTLIDA